MTTIGHTGTLERGTPPLTDEPVRPESVLRAATAAPVSRVWWAAIAAVLVCGLIFNEFPTDGPPPAFYSHVIGGFSLANLVVLFFAYAAAVRRLLVGPRELSRTCVYVTVATAIPIVMSIWVGVDHGSTDPFGSWKNLLMGALFAFGLWSTVLRTSEDAVRFARLFLLIVSTYSAFLLVRYWLGGGVTSQTLGRTPVFDRSTLGFLIAAVALGLAMLPLTHRRNLLLVAITLPSVVLVLSLRRFAWTEFAIVVFALGVMGVRVEFRHHRRLLPLVLVASVAAAVVLGTGGSRYIQRLSSFDLFKPSTAVYATTNQSHLDDILDGWDQVRRHPFSGLGGGVRFVGARTSSWKGQGGDIHNGILTVWVIFGLLGVVEYLGGHALLFRALWPRTRDSSMQSAITKACLAFILAQFLVSLAIVTWPFGFWQTSILTFSLIALGFTRDQLRPSGVLTASRDYFGVTRDLR